MAVLTKAEEIARLKKSGNIAATTLQRVATLAVPGVSTKSLDLAAEKLIRQAGGEPAFLGYQEYPATLCTSINDEVVHGIPSEKKILQSGDIIGLDIGVVYEGIYTDTAITVSVGSIEPATKDLLTRTEASLYAGLDVIKPGARVGDIGQAIEDYIKKFGYGIVRQLTGHGLGYTVHEAPSIPNFGRAGTGQILVPGMVLAIEPMVTLGDYPVVTDDDGWTVRTADQSLAAHFEHTIIVTNDGMEIITKA